MDEHKMESNIELRFGRECPAFFCDEEAFSGVRRVCDWVRQDIRLVTDVLPEIVPRPDAKSQMVLVGTLGHSRMLDRLAAAGKFDPVPIRGKWEVFSFSPVAHPFPGVECALVIAGSDKRGTIYGLLHLSRLFGVSPLVDWADVLPPKQSCVTLDERCTMVSREPSVRYRGIFLNDEWPALGNWAKERFGGFNVRMYSHVFQLILRLRGNYLWPAMWNSNFNLDGPGLENAELADELGIVMGSSHHEPCMRAGEEYGLMRGKDSVYGDAWNFVTNREGITRFWEDGLKRNSRFENMITVGMRGEQDTPIMGKIATLRDNIELLRDVLHTQNRLIRENICQDLSQTHRLFVLFTEVEAFYYGNEQTPGLIGDPELEGVTLMLSDDNFGNLRSLPTREMLRHPGGFGLYYHLDFHGGAYAYDWMNTNYLPKMWEQLTTAYEGGIREVWIANVGDVCLLEYPLCYFMDLAYDMDAYGVRHPNETPIWTDDWVRRQFGGWFDGEVQKRIAQVLWDYTLINHNRKPEVMHLGVYHPVHYGESETLRSKAEQLERETEALLALCPEPMLPAFWDLVCYPASASANHCLMWLCAERNHYCAAQGRMEANRWGAQLRQRLLRDRDLMLRYHDVGNRRFFGMALSEHIGFVSWCEDGNIYPADIHVNGVNKPRLLVADALSEQTTIGSRWTGDTLRLDYGLDPRVQEIRVELACQSRMPVHYTVHTDCPWLKLSHTEGTTADTDILTVRIDHSRLRQQETGKITVDAGAVSQILIDAVPEEAAPPAGVFVEYQHVICIEADQFSGKGDTVRSSFVALRPYGRTGGAVKAFPPELNLTDAAERPYVEYTFLTREEGEYTLLLYMAPSNTATMAHRLCFGLQVNSGEISEINGTLPGFRSLDLGCREWDNAVRNNIRIRSIPIQCRKGLNHLRLYAISPLVVFERLILHPASYSLPSSYLGPK